MVVEASTGKGSRFHHVRLIDGTDDGRPTFNQVTLRRPVILVVDDEALLRMLAVEHFEDSGYEVLEARDGSEAIAILKGRPDIQAIFTDVQMPGQVDGFGVAREARDVIPDCAVVVVSARQWPQSGDLQPGMRFITKPYSGQSVVRMFNEMLAEH